MLVYISPLPPFTGAPGPKSQKKSQNTSFWGSAEKSQNIPEKVYMYRKNDLFGYFFGIFRLFQVFFETFLQTPKKTLFEMFFCDFGPGGPEDSSPVNGGSGRNPFSFHEYQKMHF